MALENPISTPTTVVQQGDTVYTQILQKLLEIEQKAAKDAVIIQKLLEELAKRKADKEKLEKLKLDLKNVTKKLPTVLTTNEKKRYQEIGKRFLLGAEQQFHQIQKRIKTKLMMNTSKDYFLKGFEKIKELKLKNKKKSFWKVLLSGLVIIGAAAFLFRDKILKMIPDLTEQSSGIFSRVKKYVGNLLRGCWLYITKTLGGSVVSIFNRLITQSIPNILQVFFFDTLPRAIFNTYLAILSIFAESALDRMKRLNLAYQNSLVLHDINSTINELLAKNDEEQLNPLLGLAMKGLPALSTFNDVVDGIRNQTALIPLMVDAYLDNIARWTLYRDNKAKGAEAALLQLGWIMETGNLDSAASGDWLDNKVTGSNGVERSFDMLLFYKAYNNYTGNNLDLRLAHAYAIANSKAKNKKLAELQYMKNIQAAREKQKGDVDARSKSVKHGIQVVSDAEAGARLYKKASNSTLVLHPKASEKSLGDKLTSMGYIQLKFLLDTIADKVGKFLLQANKFVNDGSMIGFFRNKMDKLVENVSEYFNKFFIGTLDVLKGVLYGIMTYVDPAVDLKTDQGNKDETKSTNGPVVNVDMGNNNATQIATIIGDLASSEASVAKLVSLSTELLRLANGILRKLGEMHGLSLNFCRNVVGNVTKMIGELGDAANLQTGTLVELVLSNTKRIANILKKMETPKRYSILQDIRQTYGINQ